ncbi:MAG: WD40 repeat domain-containing protein [Lachnospiraceae bacterium]|nr:WD40 repeat domain-containing protein [Ruminococcus sp.]MCM1275062.1 WD40 repeat domain-containing protein [Lachnospiraceae bacterium]
MDERNDMNKFRNKRKRNKLAVRGAIFLAVVVGVILIAANWRSIIAPFKDMALNAGDGGFPVSLPGSTRYTMGELGENFYLMTDTYLYTYNAVGAELSGFQHGFQNPAVNSNDRRTLVFDKNGLDFKVFSRTNVLFSNTMDDSIVFAQMGNTERCAVITTSSRYFNYLYIFNGEGKQIFRWASPDEKIMQVSFGPNDNSFFAAVVGESGGELRTSVVKFDIEDIENATSESWRTYLGSDISFSLERCGDGVYVVTSGGAYLLDEQTGEVTAETMFSRQVEGISGTDGVRVIMFHDAGSNGEIAVAYGDALEAAAAITPDDVTAFDVCGGNLYILSGSRLVCYNSMLEAVKTYELDDVYSDVKILNGSAYLLGYNTVQRWEL